ncbi:hypothetical protein MAPG_07693 [Magnaporthiopsis poae ATCC 64411]|uniref:Uncharacterized protein n=1 Tax=Magnaporthiopsis poae (strain ATCC 64411 / 73-15) TaxID=644358 RepID=A0A0C4E5C7_MAGP6|nr:hypothetical protein MAPG_07693 [Magnaporthiopsis poae ATCC 64411]
MVGDVCRRQVPWMPGVKWRAPKGCNARKAPGSRRVGFSKTGYWVLLDSQSSIRIAVSFDRIFIFSTFLFLFSLALFHLSIRKTVVSADNQGQGSDKVATRKRAGMWWTGGHAIPTDLSDDARTPLARHLTNLGWADRAQREAIRGQPGCELLLPAGSGEEEEEEGEEEGRKKKKKRHHIRHHRGAWLFDCFEDRHSFLCLRLRPHATLPDLDGCRAP